MPRYRMSFNSLQTGKQIQSEDFSLKQLCVWVSIPFKRESRSKVRKRTGQVCRPWSFNSLQTGKQIQSSSRFGWGGAMLIVSIPFKRESRSKVNPDYDMDSSTYSFNSLQTGKQIQRHKVSPRPKAKSWRFNSLQTGKQIQSQTGISGSAGRVK